MLPRRSKSVCLSAELSLGLSASIMRVPSSFGFCIRLYFTPTLGPNQPYIKLVLSDSFTEGKEAEA
jgi:hypothetical protein